MRSKQSRMDDFLEGLKTFECPPPDPSEIISGGAPACTWLPRTKEWTDNIQKSRKGYRHSKENKQKIKNSLLGAKHTEERRRNNSIGSCKYQYTITSPDGEVFYETNMKAFCMDKDIDPGAMRNVAHKKYKHHKGWTVEIVAHL
jgi:hypothetical protein